jgi:hypothetical protein
MVVANSKLDEPVPASVKPDASSPRRVRFSLRALILTIVFLALAFSHVLTSIQLWKLRRDLQRMRGEVGLLDIQDWSQVHATRITNAEYGRWRFRIYVPPGKKVDLCWNADKSAHGYFPRGRGHTQLSEGEQFVMASIYQDENGKWKHSVASAGMAMGSEFVGDHVLATPTAAATWQYSVAGKTEVMKAKESLVLLRFVAKRTPPGESAAWGMLESVRGDGFQLWIEDQIDETAK